MTSLTEPVATFKKRGAKAKANIRKREATPPPADDSSSGYSSSEDGTGNRIKRRKKTMAVVAASSKDATASKHSAADWGVGPAEVDRSIPISDSNDATKQSNWYEKDDGTNSKSTKSRPTTDPAAPDGTYKGPANQTSYIERNPDRQSRTVGPVKAPTNIRTITVTDFAPDVCKDYKNTGWCGFGDSCKFLHAREDYKQGWQLDKEWETVTKGKKNLGGTIVASADRSGKKNGEEDDDEDVPEDIPFACIICNGPYKSPIVTRCGHYFCEGCALRRYRRDPSCAACGTGTQGVFNVAKKLQKLLEKKTDGSEKTKWKSSGFKAGTMEEVKDDGAEQAVGEDEGI
ncbi:hypothetical protein GE09DRAFT_1129812 [Coniochaeta sp. 2T2.1]|nr:hypothetical protein GE09DRAFT_1129812 [Coniochaeta sp. 2T2.1]